MGREWRGRRASVRRDRVSGRGAALAHLVVKAASSGPVVVITSNLHGDECTGIGTCFRVAERLADTLLCGEVHLYPSLNPEGLARGSRGLPNDALDPNRAFPGSHRGTPARRHAGRIWSEVLSQRPDAVIDLHTDSGGAIPYAIVDRVVRGGDGGRLEARCVALAQASGLTVLHEYPTDRYVRFELDRSLPGALVNGPGVPAVTLEVGPRRRIDPESVALTTAATLGVLTELAMVELPASAHVSRLPGGPWRRESGPRATRAGLLLPALSTGTTFRRGQRLATVSTLDGEELEVLRAASDGVVVALPEAAHIEVGAACATVAVLDDEGSGSVT